MRNYETKLPEGYLPVYQIDANDKKIIWAFNVASLLLFAVVAVPLFAWIEISTGKSLYELLGLGIIRYLILIVIYISYIFLHELTHGLAYYMLTWHPLTFALSVHVGGCVGDLWVAIVLTIRFRGRDQLLVRDIGPKQIFCDKKNKPPVIRWRYFIIIPLFQ